MTHAMHDALVIIGGLGVGIGGPMALLLYFPGILGRGKGPIPSLDHWHGINRGAFKNTCAVAGVMLGFHLVRDAFHEGWDLQGTVGMVIIVFAMFVLPIALLVGWYAQALFSRVQAWRSLHCND